MKYIYLPLDDRPCTMDFPVQLASAAGMDVTVPGDLAGKHFKNAYPFERAERFLEEHAENDACLILAVDAWCYGGLLQSRSMGSTDAQTAMDRLNRLRMLKARFPGMQIHAFSVIMRASISTLSQADLVHYHNMTLFCQLSHKARVTGSEEDIRALEEVKAQLPKELVDHYLSVRERNHRVNLCCVEMAKAGVFDSLMLLQEDAQVYGLHRLEQEKLLEKAAGCERIFLHNGADEGGVAALMTAIAKEKGLMPRVQTVYLRGDDGQFVARYEDRLFCDNLKSYMRYAGMENADDAEHVLFILSPDWRGQRDMTDDIDETDDGAARRRFAMHMAEAANEGKKCYLLDLTLANGGLPGILQAVDDTMGMEKLWGYSAWNTTCNALGTILAQMLSDMLSGSRNESFLWERVLDDCLYEGVMRVRLRKAVASLGEDPMSMTDRDKGSQMLENIAREEMEKHPFIRRMPCAARYSLPWPRVFECRVNCGVK